MASFQPHMMTSCMQAEWGQHVEVMGRLFQEGQVRLDKRLAKHREAEMRRLARPPQAMRPSASSASVSHRAAPTLTHRSAPTLPGMGSLNPHSRSAPTLGSPPKRAPPPPRILPVDASSRMLPPHICRALIERANAKSEELAIFVEIAPQKSRQLHQDREQYERHLDLLSELLRADGNLIRSDQFPDASSASLSVACEELPKHFGDEWAKATRRTAAEGRTAAALDDYRQTATRAALRALHTGAAAMAASNHIASNQSWHGASPLRHGAFEVYLVVKAEVAGEARVVLLFSKLFSRCWPRASAVLARLRRAVRMEMALREERHARAIGAAFVHSGRDAI